MAEVKWIKITTSMFDDEKISLIQSIPEGDAVLVIWIRLLLLAGKVNDNGFIYLGDNLPYTEEMLATIFKKQINIVRLALATFEQFGMIELTTKGIYLPNWEKHQSTDKLEAIREYNRLAKQQEREKKKLLLADVNDKSRTCHGCQGTDKDIDKDIDKEKDIYAQKFNDFWKAYPKKRSKGDAEKAWKKLKPNEQLHNRIMKSLEQAKTSVDWTKEGGKYIPYPATWLNAKGWLDEYAPGPKSKVDQAIELAQTRRRIRRQDTRDWENI